MNNKAIKILIFLIFFSIILIFFLFFNIVPKVKQYKTNQVIINKYKRIYIKEKLKLKTLKQKEELTYKKYKKQIVRYNNNFNQDNLKNFIKHYMDNLSFQKDKNNKYRVSGSIDNISKFYDLINNINSYKNIVKIDFPIVYKYDTNKIMISFFLTILNN